MPPVNFGLLRNRRDELDLSNAELANRMEMAVGSVTNILYGSDEPSQRVIYRFSRVLGIPVSLIEAGKRTPKGDPSEPPNQPKNEPKGPPPRTNGKGDRRGPRRNVGVAAS